MAKKFNKFNGYEIKPIPGYNGRYSVSSIGEVIRHEYYRKQPNGGFRYYPEQVLKHRSKPPHFYPYVGLSKNGKTTTYKIHRLMGFVFLGVKSIKQQINHINGNKTDNRLSNLEVVTSKENIAHAIKLGLIKQGKEHSNFILTEKQLETIKHLSKNMNYSGLQLAKYFDVSPSTIYRALGQKRTDRMYKYG